MYDYLECESIPVCVAVGLCAEQLVSISQNPLAILSADRLVCWMSLDVHCRSYKYQSA